LRTTLIVTASRVTQAAVAAQSIIRRSVRVVAVTAEGAIRGLFLPRVLVFSSRVSGRVGRVNLK